MDPAVPGVFTSPYPFGIDPVWPSHSFNIHTVVSFVAAPVLILSHAVSTDLGDGQQQAELPELVQDEDVGHHRHHSHDLWSLLVILQLPVIHQVLPFWGGGCPFFSHLSDFRLLLPSLLLWFPAGTLVR